MFEDKTYESLMTEALNAVSSDVDKREGSVIFDALAPAVYQIAQLYVQLDTYIDLFFADTAVDNYLDRIVAEVGITRKTDEDDTALRARYFDKVRQSASSGNATDYNNWAMSVDGVGAAKVIPLWNGAGTVKVLVLDTDLNIDSDLESTVSEYIESVRPIGASVTIDSPSSQTINVNATIAVAEGVSAEQLQPQIEQEIVGYLKSLIFTSHTVSIAKIGALILSIDGVTDYSGLTINNASSNVAINEYSIPELGTVTLEVSE